MPRKKNRKMGETREVGRIEKSKCGAEWSGGHMIKRFFIYYQDNLKNEITKTGSLGFFSTLASVTIFCKSTLFLFGA